MGWAKDFHLILEKLQENGLFLIETELSRLITELEGKLMDFIQFTY
jgi:hypothetical protein